MLWKRIKIAYLQNTFWFIAILVGGILAVLSVMGLFFMESYFATQQIAMLPMEMLKMIIYAVVSAYVFAQIMYKGGGGLAALGGSRKVKGENVKVTFQDVIGLSEAKREAMEVVSLIKDRAKVRRIGGKVIKGLLMMGPPGCGKTYLAKAIAHEAGVPFFSIAGSDFVEVFVGVGASRVRKIFQIARNAASIHGGAIIFIDELDAIGQTRKFSSFGSAESDNTLNQILVNMDGLANDQENNVIVIGATNADESRLDKALIRPGRFDRKIQVSPPRLKDREAIFTYYLNKVKSDPDVNARRLAQKTVWKTPADIENIVKEAALISIRNQREAISMKDIVDALDRIELGQETYLDQSPRDLEWTAFHETGHLMVLYCQHPTDDVFKASIKPRGGALGVVHHVPREELTTQNRDELYANIKTSLAGYVAEKIKYKVTSTGVSADFANAMAIAHSMVWRYGMGSNGFVGDFTRIPESQISGDIKNRLNQEVQDILHKASDEVETFLRSEWALVETFASELLNRKELDYDDIEAVFKAHGKERIRI